MQFVLVRHVETIGNIEHRFNGRTESPLTAHGEKMKAKVVQKLLAMHKQRPFDRVITSPALRTKRMGEAFSSNSGLFLEIDKNLMEFNFGAFDGLTAKEASEKTPELWEKWLENYALANLSEEGCFRDFHANLGEWLKSFDFSSNERILIFTHGGTLNSLLLHLLELSLENRWHFEVKTGGIVIIDMLDGYGILKALYSLDGEEN